MPVMVNSLPAASTSVSPVPGDGVIYDIAKDMVAAEATINGFALSC